MFSLDDRSKSYPHAEVQRVSSVQNILYAGIGPLALLIVWTILFRPGFHKGHVTIFGLFISLFLTSILTDIVKNAVGRPRPDLIARCKPRAGTPSHELVTYRVCTETDHHTLHDGFRSFPSGHSSWAFAGLGYFALVLAGQMHTFRPRVDLVRIILFLVPLVGAALIAMSRVEDYRHDVLDVSIGSALGMLIAYLSYRKHYRSLGHSKCHEPYPSKPEPLKVKSRIAGAEEGLHASSIAGFELADSDDEESETLPLHNVR